MISSSREFPDGHHIQADVIIIGSGAAGITLALEMGGTGLSVVIFESGTFGFSEGTQELYAGEERGFRNLAIDESRLRMFGGTTNHWSGLCLELDEVDFEKRPGIPHSGWPIARAELEPFYKRAYPYVEINPDTPNDVDHVVNYSGCPQLDFDTAKFRTVVMNESPPTIFGNRYELDLQAFGNIQIFLEANLLELDVSENANTVTGLQLACIDGPRFTASAKRYILAAGGIEIPRLLLLSDGVQSEGLGNENDLVGRYFMDHNTLRPTVMSMLPKGAPDMSLYTKSHDDGTYVASIMLRGSPDLIRDEKIGNFRAHFFEADSFTPGPQAIKEFRGAWREGRLPEDVGRHIQDAFTDLDGITDEVLKRLFRSKESLLGRRWIEVWVGFEQLPNPDSRIMLSDQRDSFNQRKVICDWRLGEADLRTAHRASELVAQELGRLGGGRSWSELLWDPTEWPKNTWPGKHHSGTTRMSETPATGVVNTQCRMHSVNNLYIASSAVFPTEGQASPTLTIVALSIRLADHLKSELGV
jgi:choline dehydrogenase-like flavoprotein